MKKHKYKVGLALGCGGVRGLAHLGVLKVFQEEGIEIDYISGASMGAIVGAVYALGCNLEEIEQDVLSFNKRKAAAKFVDFGLKNKSIVKGDKIFHYLNRYIKDADFKDTKIPFWVLATDLLTGEEVILKEGPILPALRASSCVPGIFPVVEIDNHYLVDGGVSNPTPFDVLEDMGANILIGVDLVMKRPSESEEHSFGIVSAMVQSYEIIRTQAVKFKIHKTSRDVILIKPKIRGVADSFNFNDIPLFIKAGEEAARRSLPEIQERLRIGKRI